MRHAKTETQLCALLPHLRSSARRLSGCHAAREDLVQETALKLLLRLEAGAEPQNLRGYAMTTLRNLARAQARDTLPTSPLSEDVAVIEPAAPSRLELAEVRREISRLPPNQARLMALVAAGETSPAALARETGQPVGSVLSRLARARASLRAKTEVQA